MPAPDVREIGADEEGIRLDRWFRRHFPEVPHGHLQKWLRTGQVRLDGRRAAAGDRVSAGQSVRVPPMDTTARPAAGPAPSRTRKVTDADAVALRDRVLYSDNQVVVIDKPPGLAVQGGTRTARHLDGMLDALALGRERPRLVHRLDRDTSGVLVLARTAAAASALTAAFRGRDVRKVYWALVVGVPEVEAGRITVPLTKRPGRGGEKVRADERGQVALTDFEIIDRAGREAAWLSLEPLTGRTHQLRVHCTALGTPILGDGKYGGAEAFLAGAPAGGGLHLHARTLVLPHPAGGQLAVEAALPESLRSGWRFFGFDTPAPERPQRGQLPACAAPSPRPRRSRSRS